MEIVYYSGLVLGALAHIAFFGGIACFGLAICNGEYSEEI